jgi:hypothetical protein
MDFKTVIIHGKNAPKSRDISLANVKTKAELHRTGGMNAASLERKIDSGDVTVPQKIPKTVSDMFRDARLVMKTPDGSIITWWKGGEIIKVNKEGVVKTWYPKPTLSDSIKQSGQPFVKGFYFEFRSDSSVVSRMPDGTYYWSPRIPGKAEIGEQIFGYDYDDSHECSESCPHDSCYECYASRSS